MNNLNILLPRQIDSGKFDTVRVLASLDVVGDLHCKRIDIFDVATFNGEFNANEINIEGLATFNKDVTVKQMTIKGSGYFNKDLKVKNITGLNEIKIKNKLIVEKLELNGISKISEIHAIHINVSGVMYSDLIKANKVELNSVSGMIKKVKGPFIKIHATDHKKLIVEEIIGCNLELSNITVGHVKGKNIIHNGCHIDHIEYI